MRFAEVCERYRADALDPRDEEDCHLMLVLLPLVELACRSYGPVWPLRSVTGLVLLAEDDWHSPWYVRIRPTTRPSASYHVQVLLPSKTAPWPGATTETSAETAEAAAQAIDAAVRYSGGWS